MLAFFLVVLIVPIALAGLAFALLDGISLKEFACIVGVCLVTAGSSAGIVSCANTHDVEVWNGRVTAKERNTVSCSHSYPCNCRQTCTGSGKNRSCTTTCDTCYEHLWDYDWDVHTTNGETVTINCVDRQGVREPSRFTHVKIGEPTSLTHSYVNYVKASPDSLFRHQGLKDKYWDQIPKYPDVYDYYRINHLVEVGSLTPAQISVPNQHGWVQGLRELNADLGAKKQVNIVVVIIGPVPNEYFYALEEAWIGGKKNDAVLVISVDDSKSMKPRWASVMAWTSNEMFKVKLRDDVMALPKIEAEHVLKILRDDVAKHYVRKPMAEYEYLSSAIKPSSTQWIITMLIAFLLAGGLTWFFQVEDPFGDNSRFRRRW